MATEPQRARFRRKVGDNNASNEVFSDTEIDDIFTESGESYTDTQTIAVNAVLIGIRELMADAAKLVTYKQNASAEQQSDIFKHLKSLLDVYQNELINIIAQSGGTEVQFAARRYRPTRPKDTPENWT